MQHRAKLYAVAALGERELRDRRIRNAQQLAKVGLDQRVSASRPTFADLAAEHIAWCERRLAGNKIKPRTVDSIRTRYRSTILPTLAGAALETWSVDEAERWHSMATAERGPVAANRAAEVLRAGWLLAERWGWVPPASSPFRFFRHFRNREEPRSRRLSSSEVDRLVDELERWEVDDSKLWSQRLAAQAILLILETGARQGEIFNLKWEEVEIDDGDPRLALRDSKTGRKTIRISDAAVAILRRVPRAAGERRVFPRANWRTVWWPIRKKLGFEDARLHDLRRTFSSNLGDLGIPPSDVAKLLGQKTVRLNSDVYRSLASERLRELANLGASALHKIRRV